MRKMLLLSSASALGLALFALPAHASPTIENSSIAAVLRNVSLSSAVLDPGVTLSFTGIVTTGGTGLFLGVPIFSAVSSSPGSVTLSDGATFAFSLGTFGSFSGIVADLTLATPTPRNRVISFDVENGTFTPGAALPDFLAGLATVTFSATQTDAGATRSNSASFTMAWPAERSGGDPGVIPAPMSLALLGAALVGLGAARRLRAPAC